MPIVVEFVFTVMLKPKSARGVTLIVWLAALLPKFGSLVALVILAWFARLPLAPAGTWTLILMAVLPPADNEANVQVTTPLEKPQLHPVPEALTKFVPTGMVSLATRLEAALGPALLTVRVKSRFTPGSTGSGTAVSVMRTSADSKGGVVAAGIVVLVTVGVIEGNGFGKYII